MDSTSVSQALQSLSEQLQAEKGRLSSFLNPQDPSFVQAFATVQHLQSSLSSLGISLEELPSLQTLAAVRSELQQAHLVASTVLEIHSERSRFVDSREELVPLVELLSRQEGKLRAVQQEEDSLTTAAWDLLEEHKARLGVEVTDLWEDFVAWSKSGCTLRVAVQRGNETISLKFMQKMLHLLGESDRKAAETGNRLSKILGKLLVDDCIEEERSSEVVKISIGRTKHDSSLAALLQQVSTLLKFTYFDLSQRDQALFLLYNNCLNLTAALLPVLKRKLLQADPHHIAALKAFVTVLAEVHYPQETLKFVERVIADAEVEIVSFRCEMLIERVRELILCQDSQSRTVSDQTEKWSISSKQGKKGEGRMAFVLPKMQVSDSVVKLVECLQSFMEEITKNSSVAALEMLISARACVQLFYSLRRFSQDSNIRNSHLSAALFHNDCLYFGHHLVLISAEIGPYLPETATGLRVISDFEPLIKSRAMDCFLHLCEDIKLAIEEKMRQLSLVKLSGHSEEAEEVLLAVVSQINTEARSLGNVFSGEDFGQFIGTVVEFAAGSVLEKIFALQQIARDDETALQQLIDQFFSLGQLFGQQPGVCVPSWQKLEVVKEILENDMNGILKLFAEGKVTQTLSSAELTKLIEAMFEDSPKRRESLRVMTGTKV